MLNFYQKPFVISKKVYTNNSGGCKDAREARGDGVAVTQATPLMPGTGVTDSVRWRALPGNGVVPADGVRCGLLSGADWGTADGARWRNSSNLSR